MSAESDAFGLAVTRSAQRMADLLAQPKPTYQVDGVQYQWKEYYEILVSKHMELKALYQRSLGPFEARSIGA